MKKYLFAGLAGVSIVVIVILLIGVGSDIYHVFHPYPEPTSIYVSHAAALKLFAIAALCLVVGVIIRFLKV